MKMIRSIAMFAGAGLVCAMAFAQAQPTRADAEKDPILKSMLQELDRSRNALKLEGFEKPFFIHGGTELYTDSFGFIGGTVGRGYFTYDIKIKNEAGGVVNQAFQWGLQWKWKKESRQALRFALLYYNGNSEYGQFYRLNDNHWGLGIYFDP